MRKKLIIISFFNITPRPYAGFRQSGAEFNRRQLALLDSYRGCSWGCLDDLGNRRTFGASVDIGLKPLSPAFAELFGVQLLP